MMEETAAAAGGETTRDTTRQGRQRRPRYVTGSHRFPSFLAKRAQVSHSLVLTGFYAPPRQGRFCLRARSRRAAARPG